MLPRDGGVARLYHNSIASRDACVRSHSNRVCKVGTMGNLQEDGTPPPATHYSQQVRSRRQRLLSAALIFVALLWLCLSRQSIIPSLNPRYHADSDVSGYAGDFDWDSLDTKSYLDYAPCYYSLQCARLELPMDWFNGTTNATISLAVIRQPALVPVTHPQYGGAILLNPGGPGGSGIMLVLRAGEYAQWVVDTNGTEGKYFDLISFDPRGVGLSRPMVDCFQDLNFAASWHERVREEGVFESSDAALGRLWSMSTAKGQSCSNLTGYGGDDMKQYVSTASAARDMLELVERHGEWREREASSLQRTSHSPWVRPIMNYMGQLEVPASLQYSPGKEKLQYYGLSYGSYLGGTFAAMFPDRVKRLVVDGVVEYSNFLSANWSSNLLDTEKTMDSFYFHCARAGYPNCVLANETGGSTPSDIKQRAANILQSLHHNPLPVYTDVLSYSDVKLFVATALYRPILVFPLLAMIFVGIEQKNSEFLLPLVNALHPAACAVDNAQYLYVAEDATMAIACSDGDDQSYMSREDFEVFAQELAEISPSIGSIWSTIRMNCIHYTLPAVHRFRGPWKANTSHPLLFIGNTADPVTPGLFARQMAEGFEGAVALMQDSGGHCSDAAFSWCTTGYIRQYFQTGELPPVNTTCAADVVPFGSPERAMQVDSLNLELMEAKERWERATEGFVRTIPGLRGGNVLYEFKKAVMEREMTAEEFEELNKLERELS